MCIRDSIYTIGTREAQYAVSTAAGGSVVGTGSMTFPVPVSYTHLDVYKRQPRTAWM